MREKRGFLFFHPIIFDSLSDGIICVNLRSSVVKFIMRNTDLTNIIKVTAAIMVKDDKIIIAKKHKYQLH
jgi:hypothetical protein